MEAKAAVRREPWSKGKIVGQKAPSKLKDICEPVPQTVANHLRSILDKT